MTEARRSPPSAGRPPHMPWPGGASARRWRGTGQLRPGERGSPGRSCARPRPPSRPPARRARPPTVAPCPSPWRRHPTDGGHGRRRSGGATPLVLGEVVAGLVAAGALLGELHEAVVEQAGGAEAEPLRGESVGT